MSKEVLLCKDCVHSRMDPIAKIFTLGGRIGNDEIHYKCQKFVRPAMEIIDMVTGPKKVKEKATFCELARSDAKKCGPEAKFWKPKHKKDLFKYMTKEHYDPED